MIRDKTKQQNSQVYNFILDFKRRNNGNSPSISQISDGVNLKNQTTWRATLQLRKDGLIDYNKNSGGFIIPGSSWKFDGLCEED